MSTSRIVAITLLVYGAALHTYTWIFEGEASSFSIRFLFWLWSLAPYIAGAVFLLLFRRPHATVGALLFPALFDAAAFYSVFIDPQS